MPGRSLELENFENDGLPCPEVGVWAEEKYKLFKLYASLFCKSMRGKWSELVYLDLFSGAGLAKIKGTHRILGGSPVIAMSVPSGFDRFVFCEQDPKLMEALRERAARRSHGGVTSFVEGDVNAGISQVEQALPEFSKGHTVLTLCFVDPFNMKNLHFSTLARLAERLVDFLVLIPTGYDATRNEEVYYRSDSEVVGRFLGMPEWRDSWVEAARDGSSFDTFITNSFGASMQGLGYRYDGVHMTHLVKLPRKHVRLYRLALFSRNELGERFWTESKKYAIRQTSLFG